MSTPLGPGPSAARSEQRLRIEGGVPLRGAASVPADHAIAQYALVLAALGEGESSLEAALGGAVFGASVRGLRELGVAIELEPERVRVGGVGMTGLRMPRGALDCGRSPLAVALFAGLLAGQRFGTRLLLAPPPGTPPLGHLVGALRARGAQIAGTAGADGAIGPPLALAPLIEGECLLPIECALPEPDELAKTALLFSGLFASGASVVSEPLLSPDHGERLLAALGVPLRRRGSVAGFERAEWSGRLDTLGSVQLPGCPVAAAVASAAALAIPGSRIALRDVGFNPTRTGFFDAVRLLGGRTRVIAKGDRMDCEPLAELQLEAGMLSGGTLGGEVCLRAGRALAALCTLGTHTRRGLRILDGEACAPEGEPFWRSLAELLARFGVASSAEPNGLALSPKDTRLLAAHVDARDDHRLALCAVVSGLAAEGESLVDHATCLDDDNPGLIELLQALGARIERVEIEPGSSEPTP